MRILGIDPGSRITGFGIIECRGRENRYVTSGCIRVKGESLAERLQTIFEGISEVIETQGPDTLAIEQVFMHRNPSSALKLGHARGVAMVAGTLRGVPVVEYTPTQIKQAITGKGHAAKEQIQHMVTLLLNLPAAPAEDAADALAVAICHAHTRHTLERIPEATCRSGGRLQ